MKADPAQLTLPVHLRDEATLENFLFPEGLEVLSGALHYQLTSEGEHGIYVYGATGSGRTHLLQAACHALPTGESLYLPLGEFAAHSAAEVLDGVEHLTRVCLDDIHAVTGNADWEQALFHLVNRCRESGCRLLFSADRAPRQLSVSLPDLGSRLSGCVVFQLPEPTDAHKLQVLGFRAGRRGMHLSEEAARYILTRAPRGLGDLMELLDRLDRDSMAARRQLTIPFIKGCLGW
jgi:DnaA family protein